MEEIDIGLKYGGERMDEAAAIPAGLQSRTVVFCLVACPVLTVCFARSAVSQTIEQEENHRLGQTESSRVDESTHDSEPQILSIKDVTAELYEDPAGVQTQTFRKARLVQAGKHFGEHEYSGERARYDILQEARASNVLVTDNGTFSLVIRWETSFSYRVSSVETTDNQQRRVFRVEPEPSVRFMVFSESSRGHRDVLIPPANIPTVGRDLTLSNGKNGYVAGGGCHSWLDREVASSIKVNGREQHSAEMASVFVGLGVWPKNAQATQATRRRGRDDRDELIAALLAFYRQNGKYVPTDEDMNSWIFNAQDWPVMHDELYVHVDMKYEVRADDRIDAPLHPLKGWCVFVPRGARELHDMEVSSPVILRTYPYRESWNDRLKPLLEVDSIRPLELRVGT